MDGPLAPELDVLGAVAPDARAALLAGWEAAHREVDPSYLDLARRRVEDQLHLSPDPGPEPRDDLEQALADLVDQFAFYVPQVTEDLRAPVRDHLGEDGLTTFIDALYALDQTTRLRLSHARLFDHAPASTPAPPPRAPRRTLDEANHDVHAAAMRLDRLDPLTTEIVRLRAANYHDCKT